MNNKQQVIIFMVAFILLSLITFRYILISARKVFEELRNVEKQAIEADSVEALQEAWTQLIEVNKKCWHRYHHERVREIKAVIETKYTFYNESFRLRQRFT